MQVINELSKLDNSNIHKKSKLHGERALKKISNNLTKLLIIRPCNLFGFPFDKSKIVGNYLLINDKRYRTKE